LNNMGEPSVIKTTKEMSSMRGDNKIMATNEETKLKLFFIFYL
jgi:hypothetical protein